MGYVDGTLAQPPIQLPDGTPNPTCAQWCKLDYNETFSPDIKLTMIRVILAIVVTLNWQIKQLDVANAFLYGCLLEKVYMT